MRAKLVVLLALIFVGGTAGGQEDAVAKEKKKLQGLWTLAQLGNGGVPNSEKSGVLVVSFQKDRFEMFTLVKEGKNVVKKSGSEMNGSYVVDPSKTPHFIDFIHDDSPAKKGKVTVKAIYALEGEQLKIAYGPSEEARPKEIAKKGDAAFLVFIYEQAKE